MIRLGMALLQTKPLQIWRHPSMTSPTIQHQAYLPIIAVGLIKTKHSTRRKGASHLQTVARMATHHADPPTSKNLRNRLCFNRWPISKTSPNPSSTESSLSVSKSTEAPSGSSGSCSAWPQWVLHRLQTVLGCHPRLISSLSPKPVSSRCTVGRNSWLRTHCP